MIPKIKQVASAAAKAINSIPSVIALRALNRKIKTVIALSLFRRRRFIPAALARYWFGFISSLVIFSWAWVKFIHDPSPAIRYAKILTLFIPVSYEAMKIVSRVEYYRSRDERRKMPRWNRALKYDESLSHVPDRLWQLFPFLGSWGAVLLAIYLAS